MKVNRVKSMFIAAFAAVFAFVAPAVAANVAKIDDTEYDTLSAAIAAASTGNTITLLADVNESVTISKSITIDGNGKTYTGTMTLNASLTITIQNLNFLNGGITKTTKNTTGTYTIKNCNFDGNEGQYAYSLSFKGASKIVVEDCFVKDFMYSFLYVSSGTSTVSVKDVTVENCPSYGIFFSSGVATATFENFHVKNSSLGFSINNTAKRTFTIKNCTMENVKTSINHSKGTSQIICKALGVNDFGGGAISQYATIESQAEVTKTEDNIGYFGDLVPVVEKAQDGDTVKLLNDVINDVSLTGETCAIAEGKSIVFDMNGKKIAATDNKESGDYELFRIDGGMTVKGNGTIELTADTDRLSNAYSSIFYNNSGNLTIDDGTFKHNGGTTRAYVIYTNANSTDEVNTVVLGGAFTQDVSEFCAEGLSTSKNEDNMFVVIQTPDVQPGLLFIKMVGGEPRIGVDVAVDALNLVAKINLDDAEWVSIDCVKADDDADEYLWFKPTLNDTNGNAYRFFKLVE